MVFLATNARDQQHRPLIGALPESSDYKDPVKAENGKGKPNLRYAWYVLAILTGMLMFSFVDRQILSLLVPSIKRDLGVSDTQIGLPCIRTLLHVHGIAPGAAFGYSIVTKCQSADLTRPRHKYL